MRPAEVWLHQQAELFEFHENPTHSGGRDAKVVPVGEGDRADGGRRSNVLLNEGGEDDAGAIVQEPRASLSSNHAHLVSWHSADVECQLQSRGVSIAGSKA